MEHLINPNVKGIQISGIRQFFNRVADYPDAVQLTIGQPDFTTPEHIKEAAKRAIDQNRTTYTHNAGLIELREAAAHFLSEKYGLNYDPQQEVIITNGASQAIDITLRTILEEGSEVILPGPVYPGYEPLIRLSGAVPVFIDTTDQQFKLTAERIKAHMTSKTRCIILPYPSNPTGCVLTKEELEDIAQLIGDKHIFVLADEIYSELVYDHSHQSIAACTGMKDKTIVINGLSKSHAMTGWRIGFTCGPSYLIQQMLKVHQYNITCTSSISQYAALEALEQGMDDAEPMKSAYRKRRDYVYERLLHMGLDVVKPEGAFYLFPSIKRFNLSSFDFATELLDKERVAVVPGSAFSQYGEGYVRISYAYAKDVLENGCDRLEAFIQSKQK